MDTEGEDHPADETRYACMARPYSAPIPTAADAPRAIVVGANTVTLNDMWAQMPEATERI